MLKFKKMGSDKVPLLLVTANVGSIFEEPSTMLPIWTSEFLQAVSRMDPKFIGLHLQEVGGKTYEKSMQYVKELVQRLCDCPELRLYDKIRIFLDEDYSSPEKFTALGNMYFSHSSLTDLKIWDFVLGSYVNVEGTEIHSGNIEKVSTKEKCKFPQNFFPECKWSRKGFLRTRWLIRGTAVELVNVHLFHDASNLLAMEPFPSVYCKSRRRALRHVLRHLHADAGAAPYFIFGDFNFRTDTGGVVKLQRFDRELDALKPHLFEFPVKFPPSYPFAEDVAQPTHYMKTRCPAWCDRVLLSQTARLLVQPDGARAEHRHLHASRKSVCDSTDSSAGGSADSSPARSASPHHHAQSSPSKSADKKTHPDLGLSVPGLHVSRKSIADPTSVQQALNCSRDPQSPARRRLVRNQSEGAPRPEPRDAPRRRAEYGVIGDAVCMGDHKPIYLRVMLQSDRGTTRCCDSVLPCFYCKNAIRLPSAHSLAPKLTRLPTDPSLLKLADRLTEKSRTSSLNDKLLIPNVEITDYSSYDVLFVNEIDETLLNPKARFDPYTPESIDSHTPVADAISSDSNEVTVAEVDTAYVKLSRDRSVSPTQLKSRLDRLLHDKTVPELERLDSRESCMSGKSRSGKESLCCLVLKCYRFWRRSKLCSLCRSGSSDCCAP